MTTGNASAQVDAWAPERLPVKPLRLLVTWFVNTVALLLAALLVPGVHTNGIGAAVGVLVLALLNAILPPVIAALRLPFTVAIAFVLVLAVDAVSLLIAAQLTRGALTIDSFWSALGVVLVASAVATALDLLVGANDDDTYAVRVTQRVARRSHERQRSDAPGIVFLEIDGLALPVLLRAMRSGSAPNLAGWVASGSHRLMEWETDLSSQTGASQAGLLLGSNDDIPAFRWVEKESKATMTCSRPADCAEIERRRGLSRGLLADGGASRGNLFSGGAAHVILTVSRSEAERRANPGYRAFFANGYNVARALVLFAWEVLLELIAAARARRRKVWPRGHRGGTYPLLRAALCVVVRDLVVFGVLSDMMVGRPAVYATFSSYDEVAHHSGLESADTLEALRKVDQQIGRIRRAGRFAPRPYEVVVLSDHGQTQGATFRQRNGYGLEDLVRSAVVDGAVGKLAGGDENDSAVERAVREAAGGRSGGTGSERLDQADVVVLGSGNLGLVYLTDVDRRLSREEIDARHPHLLDALRRHPHVGWLLVRSDIDGPIVLGAQGSRVLSTGAVSGADPLAPFAPTATQHLRRSDGFPHVADVMVGAFFDPVLEESCAFEELISFHGGLGGPQTRPFLLYPAVLPAPEAPLIGAVSVHRVLVEWRRLCNQGKAGRAAPERVAV